MMFRHLVSTLILVLLAASPVLGQGNGHGNGNGSDQGSGGGNGNDQGSGGARGGPSDNNGSGNGAAGGEAGQNGNQGSNGENGRAGQDGSNAQERANSGASNSVGTEGGTSGASLPPGSSNRQDGNIVTLSPDEALEAVRSRQAATLAEIAENVKNRAGGDIIDANLLQVGQMLIYAVKVLDEGGQLSIQYYYARSGRYIGSE